MAKKTESVDYQKLVSEICGILKVEEANVVEAVRQYAQAAGRPIVAAAVLLDPIAKEPRVVFLKNSGDTSFAEAEFTLNAAIDHVKALKAQEAVKQQMKAESEEPASQK